MHISAVVCTHNRSSYLKKAVQSLVDQTLPKEQYEVIVVDNGSRDNTKAVVDSFERFGNLRYIYEPILGLSQARNTGWRNAQGEYVAYIDDDAIACPEWLEKIVATFETVQPRPGSVGGKITLIWETERPAWLMEELEIPLGHLDWGDTPMFLTEGHQRLGGGNVAYPCQILREFGGFSTSLGRKGGNLLSNDEILLKRCLEGRNLGSYYDPEICVQHHVLAERVMKRWFYRRYFWQGISSEILEYLETGEGGFDLPHLSRALLDVLRFMRHLSNVYRILMPANSGGQVLRKCYMYYELGRIAAQARIGFGQVEQSKRALSLPSLRAWLRVRTRIGHALQLVRDVYIEWGSRKAKRGMKCALIEYTPVHGEILPTLVYILNVLGVSVDVYTSPRVIRTDPFVYSPGLSYTLREADELFFKLWVARRQFRDYDVLVLNSLEPKDILQRVAEIPIPIIAVMHNGNLINNDPDYARFFAASSRKPLVLAKHISELLSKAVVVRWISPVFLGEVKLRKINGQANIRFLVQGNLHFNRRNYDSLLDAIEQLASDGVRNFRVMVVGRNDTEHGLTFKEQVKNRKLDGFFEFSKGELTYQDYYASIATASFVLPLVDTSSLRYKAYFLDKITSSLSIAIGFGIVPVIHRELARLYGVEEQSITYEDGGLSDALKLALSTKGEALDCMRRGLVSKKEALLHESILSMKKALSDVGVTPPYTDRER